MFGLKISDKLQKKLLFLLQVKLELSEPDIIFEPSLDNNIVNNFYDQILELIDDVFHMTRLIPRYESLLQFVKYRARAKLGKVAAELKVRLCFSSSRIALPGDNPDAESEIQSKESHKGDCLEGRNYYDVITNHKELKQMTEQLQDRIKSVMKYAMKHKTHHMEHSYLWTESRYVQTQKYRRKITVDSIYTEYQPTFLLPYRTESVSYTHLTLPTTPYV